MAPEAHNPVRCPRCPGRSRTVESRGQIEKLRRRECTSCAHRWGTVEVTREAFLAMQARAEELEDELAIAREQAEVERRQRMADIRAAVQALAKFAQVDHEVRLRLEFLKTRGQFLHQSLSHSEAVA